MIGKRVISARAVHTIEDSAFNQYAFVRVLIGPHLSKHEVQSLIRYEEVGRNLIGGFKSQDRRELIGIAGFTGQSWE